MHRFASAKAMLAIAALFALTTFALTTTAHAQVSITGTGPANQYTQNFDSLLTTGSNIPWADNSTIAGWYSTRTTYNAATGSSNAGALYSFGSTTVSADRALGGVGSGGTGTFYWAVRLANNSGVTWSSIDVSFNGEQWRDGGATTPVAQTLSFNYQAANAGVITAANTPITGWNAFTALDFVSPTFTNTGAGVALDGNATANRTAKSANIAVSVAPGQEIWLRWTDINDSGNDHGLAVDDLVVVANASTAQPTLSVTAPTINEGDSGTTTATFTVSLDIPAPASGVNFTINTADGTATAGSDYAPISTGSGTITSGNSSTTIDVTINGDTTFEGNETFSVNLSGITGTVNSSASATATIIDNDAQPTVTVGNASVIEGGTATTTTANFAVTLSNPSAFDVTFTAQTNDGTATLADNDYVALTPTTITIPAGATSGNIGVIVNGDANIEPDENFALLLSNASGGTLANSSATGTIQNDDAVTPTFSINNVAQNEGDSGTSNFVFTVSSNVLAPTGGYTLNIDTADGTATVASNDYVAAHGTVTILAGASSAQFIVVVNGDRTAEPDETFSLTLSNPPAGTLIANATGTGTIHNDDVTPALSVADMSVSEGNSGTTTATFTVSLDHPALDGGVAFTINTADGTATVADNDYVAIANGSGTIAAGASSTTVNVTVNGDTKFESNETFALNLTAITGATNSTASATGTITNDDSKPTLSIANVSVNEGNSGTATAHFTATLTAPAPDGGVSFSINTADATATAGSDYVAIVNSSGAIAAGATTTTIDVTVNGDTVSEANETFTLNLSAITNTTNATASATGTILNDDTLTLMQIQGHGTASLLNGQIVTTAGVVTAKKSNGFFMQDPLGDGDPTTSDAIFVFTSSAPAVAVGDGVSVTGTVQEFSGSTELSFTPTVAVTAHPAAVQPQAHVLDTSAPTNDPTTGICMGGNSTIPNPPPAAAGYQASNFACLDGMLVTMNDAVVTGATFGNGASDGVHTGNPTGMYVTVGSQPRPFRSPGAPYPGIAGHPEIPVSGGEPEVIEIFYAGLAFNPTGFVYDAGTHFTTTGVIQGFQATGATSPIYEIYPYNMSTLTPAPTYPQPVADSAAGTLTIGSQNLLHFFNAQFDGLDTTGYTDQCLAPAGTDLSGNVSGQRSPLAGGANDTCPTPTQYSARLSKWARQVCQVLKAPVVLDMEEIENRAVAKDLADNIFGLCSVSYLPYVIPGNDVSGINIGILVRSDVTVDLVTQMYKGTQTNNCSGATPCLLNDRPPVLMQASWNGYNFALLAIYDRSLSGLGDPTKPYIGPKRAEQAAQIASIAQAWQSGATLAGAGSARQNATGFITQGPFDIVGIASVPLIVAGDFNAYEFSDGYADVTGMIAGTADQSKNLYWYSGDPANTDTPTYIAPNPPLVDSGIKAVATERYSFNFSGLAQEIDHILLSQLAWRDFVSVSNAHGNSDVSEASSIIFDGMTAARSGDHDGQVVTIAIDRIFADGSEAQP